jgi:hypothetical protein
MATTPQNTQKITAAIQAFQNETESLTISELTIENRLDRVSIYGSVDITRDKQGLEYVLDIKRQIDAIAEYLEKEELPDRIEVARVKEVENPFTW